MLPLLRKSEGTTYTGVYAALPTTTPDRKTFAVSIRVTDRAGTVATMNCGVITVGGGARPVSRRELGQHQVLERRMFNLNIRRLNALLRAHQLLERRLLQIDPLDGPNVSRRALNTHQRQERRELNLKLRRLSALFRAHQLTERRLQRAW